MKKLIVKKSIEIHTPAATIWDIINSPDAMKQWMLVPPEVEDGKPLHLGSKVLWKDADGKAYLTGTVTTYEPEKKLVLSLQDVSWTRPAKPGEVTYAFALSTKGGTTHVTFTLGDLSIDPDAREWYDAYNESRELEIIKQMAEGQN